MDNNILNNMKPVTFKKFIYTFGILNPYLELMTYIPNIHTMNKTI